MIEIDSKADISDESKGILQQDVDHAKMSASGSKRHGFFTSIETFVEKKRRVSMLCFAAIAISIMLVVIGQHCQYFVRPSDPQRTERSPTSFSAPAASAGTVLVTGATGRTGSKLYLELKRRGTPNVRALVRDKEKAKAVLGCVACDETEGIYIGDVTKFIDLERVMADGSVRTLAIAVGAGARSSPDVQREVEFNGVVNSVKAFALAAKKREYRDVDTKDALSSQPLRVVLCSSMGTNQTPSPPWAGDIMFWKLNAEAFLSTSGISSTMVVKPCGLDEKLAGNNSTLIVGHNGTITEGSAYHTVSRDDLANVMAEGVLMPHACGKSPNLRFDLCSKPGPPTEDLKALIESSRWEWDI